LHNPANKQNQTNKQTNKADENITSLAEVIEEIELVQPDYLNDIIMIIILQMPKLIFNLLQNK